MRQENIFKPNKYRVTLAVILAVLFYQVTTPISYLPRWIISLEMQTHILSGNSPIAILLPIINMFILPGFYIVGWYVLYVIILSLIRKDFDSIKK